MDKKIEPKIDEVFTLDSMTLKCVIDTSEADCTICALFHSMRCVEMSCCPKEREDFTHVHFVKVQDGQD